MKVLMTMNAPAPYRIDFCNELGKLCDLTVTYERRYSKDREKSWQDYKGKRNFREVYLNGLSIGNETALCLSILSFLKSNKFDCIIIGGYSTPTGILSILYLHFKNIKFIINTDGGQISENEKFKYFIKKYLISKASAWLSTSKITDDYLLYYGAEKKCIYRYPFTSLFQKEILDRPLNKAEKKLIRDELGITEDKIIITVGSFIYRKGYDVLLNSLNENDQNVGVYIVGGLPTDEYLDILNRRSIRFVHFVSFSEKITILKYLKAADIFVMPTRYEAWGLVVNEAMACGLPVITTNKCVAGIELVENQINGYIVPVENPEEMRLRIFYLLNNEDLLNKMCSMSLIKIKNYTIEKMAETVHSVIDELFSSL